jgi:WD40 repeat protein
MFVSFSNPRPNAYPSALLLLAAALATAAIATSLHAQGTHLWTQSRIEDFEKGTPKGVAITSDGHLLQGPATAEVLTTPSTFVWSVAADPNGTAYVGTASPASVLRIGKDGKPFTLFETTDLSVQVVRLGPDGLLYVATLPSGKVYRLHPDATAKQDENTAALLFDAAKPTAKPAPSVSPEKPTSAKPSEVSGASEKSDSKSHYIWDMTFDSKGRLYIATGGPAAVYRLDPAKPTAPPEEFFKSDEEHIRTLAWDSNGNLIAGSDGSGLVYRISPDGKGFVLFQSPRREITAVTVAANGTIYAASVGDKSHNPLPPLPLQGNAGITITVVQPGSLQAANNSNSLPDGTEIYALVENQAPRKLWSGKEDIVYALAARPDGLLALTGNRGHVLRIAEDGGYADIAHLDAQQGLSMSAPAGTDTILIGTGNTGKLVRLGTAPEHDYAHEYASDVLDAGAFARFGHIEVEPGSTGYQLFARSGNVEQPVRGWSDWQPLNKDAVASPPGRFLQWKVTLTANATIGAVGVNYLPVNSAPVVDDIIVVPGVRVTPQTPQVGVAPQTTIAFPASSTGVTVTYADGGPANPLPAIKDRTAISIRWAAHDDDGDDLTYALYLRGDGEKVWRLLKDTITDKAYSFDAALIPDGGYQIKVIASDAPSHTPTDILTGEKISERFEVDTTSPVVSGLKVKVSQNQCIHSPCPQLVFVAFEAEDDFSPIARAEYSLDAGPWQFVQPVGTLSDSKHEHYEFMLPAKDTAGNSGEHLITVRVYDRHENVGAAKTVIHPTTN